MAQKVAFQHPTSGAVETVKIGFSWTSFLFADFLGIPLFNRRLYIWGSFMLIWGSILGLEYLKVFSGKESSWLGTMIFFGFLIKIFLGFGVNELAARNYIKKGWTFAYPDSLETKLGQTRWRLLKLITKPSANHAINDDSLSKLEKLASLKEKGLITDEEFIKEKSKLIA